MADDHQAPIVVNVLKGSRDTVTRAKSASDFILKLTYDQSSEELENLAKTSTDVYLNAGEEGRIRFLKAKLFTISMLRLEKRIRRIHPEWLNNNVINEDLNAFLAWYHQGEEVERLEQEEVKRVLQQTDTKYKLDNGLPEGTQLGEDAILRFLRTRINEREPDKSFICTICLEMFESGCTLANLHYCEHDYHVGCIKLRLRENNRCPLCRVVALPRQVEYPEWINDWGVLREFLRRDIA